MACPVHSLATTSNTALAHYPAYAINGNHAEHSGTGIQPVLSGVL